MRILGVCILTRVWSRVIVSVTAAVWGVLAGWM